MREAAENSVLADALTQAERRRAVTIRELDRGQRSLRGQFMTPMAVAKLMARMFDDISGDVRLLDAGAGIGSLTAAFVEEFSSRASQVATIQSTTFELDDVLFESLQDTLADCAAVAESAGLNFVWESKHQDFVDAAVLSLGNGLFGERIARFDAAILNPPYMKIGARSRERELLKSVGLDATNLYAAFVALSIRLLKEGGQMVVIIPRSFCNGPYFRPFRDQLLSEMALRRVHVFESRKEAFGDDGVLQENVIIHAVKGTPAGDSIDVSVSKSAVDGNTHHTAAYDEVIRVANGETFIHLPTGSADTALAEWMLGLPATLSDLGLVVSTGRVVDFRSREFLRPEPEGETVPLIYPCHFSNGLVDWPKLGGKKPNAILDIPESQFLLVPRGHYVLTKRFSSKEERRRVVTVVYDPGRYDAERVGIENHINYYHAGGKGLPADVAFGLNVFLNSTPVDLFFRQFSGHTQVNATDLRSMRYPSLDTLNRMGRRAIQAPPSSQEEMDAMLREACPDLPRG